jgi:glycine cleavage system H lipoate-binding protein/ABC-type phosphate transport system substrate-binding protein
MNHQVTNFKLNTMKHVLKTMIGLWLAFNCGSGICNDLSDNLKMTPESKTNADTIKIMSSPELNSLTATWMKEYARINPTVKFSEANSADYSTGKISTLSFITDDYSNTVNNESNWKIGIGHDAIVAVFNSGNPMADAILKQGISREELAKLFAGTSRAKWSEIITGGTNASANYYLLNNNMIRNELAGFAKTDPETVNPVPVKNQEEFIALIQKDPMAIGFCKLADVRKNGTNELIENIRLLPIDKNGNGRIDSFEDIYENPDALSRGIWIGKYPHLLCGTIYAVAPSRPTDKNEQAFLTWIMADGAKVLNSAGFSGLAGIEIKSNLASLSNVSPEGPKTDINVPTGQWLFFLSLLAVAGAIFAVIIRVRNKRRTAVEKEPVTITSALNENTVKSPAGLYFDKTHTWAFMEKDGSVRIGVDDFIQHLTGPITGIRLKKTGEFVRRGEKIITVIREGKQLNLYSPVSGIIKEQNRILASDSSVLNTAPYSEGWVYIVEPKNWIREIQFMFMVDKYKEWLKDEFSRLRNFFEISVRSNTLVYAHVMLQDGGELTDNILADLGPEVWEDFQTNFIDTSK